MKRLWDFLCGSAFLWFCVACVAYRIYIGDQMGSVVCMMILVHESLRLRIDKLVEKIKEQK